MTTLLHPARLPLPEFIQCSISAKIGKALGKSRTYIGQPATVTLHTTETFNIISAVVIDTVDALVETHRALPSNDKLVWNDRVSKEIYVKGSIGIAQSKYILFTAEHFRQQLQQNSCWICVI